MIGHSDWFGKWAGYHPDKVAVRQAETGQEFTYARLDQLGEALTAAWFHAGYKKGDRIAILAENAIETIALFSAALKSGLILVPLNYRLTAMELDLLIADSTPVALYYHQQFMPVINAMTRLNASVALHDLDRIPDPGTLPVRQVNTPAVSDDDPVFILYTSGTTGVPKGTLYTYRMLFWNSINTSLRLDITSQDRSVSCMPLFHTGGWNVIPTPFFHRGATVCFTRRFDPDQILLLMESEQCTMFVAVPTMLQMMAGSAHFDQVQLAAMKYFIIGGEPMPIPLIRKWAEKGIPVRQGFGLTEVGPSVTSLHQDDAIRKMGSIGTVNFYLDYRLADESGNPVPPGTVGEFLLKGPTVTPGYWNNPELTSAVLRDGWFHTGDLVREDEDGFLFVVDRKKNMYISGGENVYPAEVERVLLTHEAIRQVAVIGIPDSRWGETGAAFLVLKPGYPLSEPDLKSWCSIRLARYKIPSRFICLDAIPLSATGKTDRKTLLTLLQS